MTQLSINQLTDNHFLQLLRFGRAVPFHFCNQARTSCIVSTGGGGTHSPGLTARNGYAGHYRLLCFGLALLLALSIFTLSLSKGAIFYALFCVHYSAQLPALYYDNIQYFSCFVKAYSVTLRQGSGARRRRGANEHQNATAEPNSVQSLR